LNYFNYFTEIEDAFVRRRGKNLLLGPIDWAMMETWQERGIPLHIVLRGIETVFDNFDKNPRPRTIKSLLFCKEEIEAQFAEWSAAQIGKAENAPKPDEQSSLSRGSIEDHIERVIEKLKAIEYPSLSENIGRVLQRLEELSGQMSDNAEEIDQSLSDIEKFLDDALLSNLDREHLKKIGRSIAAELRGYKSEMAKEAYESTYRLMLLKRIREELGVPRMGLFYL
jgi:hypothetical protein